MLANTLISILLIATTQAASITPIKLLVPGDEELIKLCVGNLLTVRAVTRKNILDAKLNLKRDGKYYCGKKTNHYSGSIIDADLLDRGLNSIVKVLKNEKYDEDAIYIIIKDRNGKPEPKDGLVRAIIDLDNNTKGGKSHGEGKPDKPEKPEKPENTGKPVKPEKPEKPGKPEKPDHGENDNDNDDDENSNNYNDKYSYNYYGNYEKQYRN